MFPTVQCPGCHARLKVPEPAPDRPMTCPQCGGDVVLTTASTIPPVPAALPPLPVEEGLTKRRLPSPTSASAADDMMPRPPEPGKRAADTAFIVVHILAVLGAAVLVGAIEVNRGRDAAPLFVFGLVCLLGVSVAMELSRRLVPSIIGTVVVGIFALIGAGSLVFLALGILMFVICIVSRV